MKKTIIVILFLIATIILGQDKKVFYGKASWYGSNFHGRKTASGEIYDINKLTAAHKDLPFGTILKVTNLNNGKSVIVKVNDRGPFVAGRVLDLSQKAAFELGFLKEGITDVKVEIVSLPGEGKRDFDFQDELINPDTKDSNNKKDTKKETEEWKKSNKEQIVPIENKDENEEDEIDTKIDDIISNLKKEIKSPQDEQKKDNIEPKKEVEPKEKLEKNIKIDKDKIADENKKTFEQKIYKIFVIQLGAFTTEEKAQDFKKKLESIGIETYITEVKRENLILHKVRENKVYTDLNTALKRMEEINKKGIECFIVAKFFIAKEKEQ
ncbi:MAG TPA: septal ring lytic transglycosylase RlpA family protein [Spirochaetota bacterium]|nr:septal ring lytic transglycosylase RlpA family protein [Spirochaetota bacterium]HOM37750.1 septal ring lytic transglycosylase RlpA family protein [Spirochaetota bacterium]HPQ49373.1 septal ring lytic transglycosylase RlpA family protein [Spirochaetota bacterium]